MAYSRITARDGELHRRLYAQLSMTMVADALGDHERVRAPHGAAMGRTDVRLGQQRIVAALQVS